MSVETLGLGSWFGGWNEIGALNLLIVQSGTPNSGVFLYNGVPASGNGPIFWATTNLLDPYGNTVTPTVGVAATGQFSAGFTLINQAGIFIYSSAPRSGNLVASIAPAAGSDVYGNAVLAGVCTYDTAGLTAQIYQGAVSLANTLDTWTLFPLAATDELDLTALNGSLFCKWAPSVMTVTGGPLVVDEAIAYATSSASQVTVVFNSSTTWTVPTGVTTLKIEAWAGGGGGGSGGGGGGGGGEYAAEPTSASTPGGTVTITIGAGGTGGAGGAFNNGTAGGNTTTTGGGTTAVTSHGGGAGQTSGSAASGGSGSTNTTHRNGGNSGSSSNSQGGAGGGGGGGSTAAGGVGGNANNTAPGAGGAGGVQGGGGGSGGGWGGSSPTAGGLGGAPGGAGGGGGYSGTAASAKAGGNGGKGKVAITYTPPSTTIAASLAGQAGTDSGGRAFPAGLMGVAATLINQSGAPATPTGQAVLWADSAGNIEKLDASGFSDRLSTGQGFAVTSTVTQAAATVLTGNWTIPASNAQVGTVYRLTARGYGTWGSTVQNLSFSAGLNGSSVRSETVSSAVFAASQHFEWKAVYEVSVISTGVTGACWLTAEITLSAVGVTHTLTTGQVTILVGSNDSPGSPNGETINTTASNTMQLLAAWASTTGAPTITCRHQTWERVGQLWP